MEGSSKQSTTSPPTPQPNAVHIDGSEGEGGGQVLRNSISYATILGKNLHIDKVRAGRKKPGLQAQHLTGLVMATEICGGRLEGGQLQSTEIWYTAPDATGKRKIRADEPREFTGDTKTAGSICLLLQAALPCALFGSTSSTKLTLKGGTNATMAPQYDYWTHIFLPTLNRKLGTGDSDIDAEVVRRGYFPRGGGEVHVRVEPWSQGLLPAFALTERGTVCDIYIRSYHAGKVPRFVAEKMVVAAKKVLKNAGDEISNVDVRVDCVTESSFVGSGSGILIVAKTTTGCLLGGSALGSHKIKAQDVGADAARELVRALDDGGCVDEWLQDQLILYMALAEGTSEILTGSLTLHTQTAIEIAERVCGAKFEVLQVQPDTSSANNAALSESRQEAPASYGETGRKPGKHLLRCRGIGFQSRRQPS